MGMNDGDLHRNINVHISDRSHWNLTLNVYGCGNRNIGSEQAGKPDCYVLCCVKEGTGYVNSQKIQAGQGFILFPNEEVRVKSLREKTMNVTWVSFSGYLVNPYLSRAGLSDGNPIFRDSPEHEVEKMLDTLLAVSTVLPNRYCKIMAQLYGIFGFLLDAGGQEPQPEITSPENYLIRALDFIDTNYQRSISVEDIADSIGISRKSLYMVFKTLTSITPKDYLTYYRVDKAAALLRENWSIEAIAVSVGYSDQSHFSKEFKKCVGLAPSVYRRMAAQDPSMEYRSPIDAARQKISGLARPDA